MKVILALDAGTTNVKAILVDRQANVLARNSVPLTIDFHRSGWVEQSAQEVWEAARKALEGCLAQGDGHEVVALGISNQRETLVAWNPGTGEAVAPCIVWQCRRSAEICQTLRRKGLEETIRAKTGLQVDPLFPSSKIQWLLENRPEVRQLAERGALCLGTVDAWLVWKLTRGQRFDAMQRTAGARLETLLADGGASKNEWLMQFQADMLDRTVLRSQTAELSGLGAAFAAGLGCGFWSSTDEVANVVAPHDAFHPALEEGERIRSVNRWNGAVALVKAYGEIQ
jgi:glycerol kinase